LTEIPPFFVGISELYRRRVLSRLPPPSSTLRVGGPLQPRHPSCVNFDNLIKNVGTSLGEGEEKKEPRLTWTSRKGGSWPKPGPYRIYYVFPYLNHGNYLNSYLGRRCQIELSPLGFDQLLERRIVIKRFKIYIWVNIVKTR